MTTDSTTASSTKIQLAIPAALLVLTFAVFWPLLNYDFVAFDDNEYVYENALVQSGLNLDSIGEAFTSTVSAHWHPLTMLSLMADRSLFGHAAGHHFTNLLLHAINVALLYFVLRAYTGAVWRSAVVAAIFALHPLHVEPVAWISSRKDVLSGTFWLLAMAAYLRYVTRRNIAGFLLVVMFLLLGLLSKSILIMLPVALLLLDVWPLQRLTPSFLRRQESPSDAPDSGLSSNRNELRRALIEKGVLLLPCIVFIAINAAAQKSAGQVGNLADVSIVDRIGNAGVAYATYLRQAIAPIGLAMYYPLPMDGYGAAAITVALALLLVLTAAAVFAFTRAPYVTIGWFWFLAILAPVAGFVTLGAQAHADRYMYLPLIGLAIAGVWSVSALLRNVPTVAFVTAGMVCAMAHGSMNALPHWRDSEAAFTNALHVAPDSYLMHYNYALALEHDGRVDDASEHYTQALAILPDHAESHNNLGALLARAGRATDAIDHFRAALARDPQNATALCNLAVALADSGRAEEALAPLRQAMEMAPNLSRTQQTAQLVMAAQRGPNADGTNDR